MKLFAKREGARSLQKIFPAFIPVLAISAPAYAQQADVSAELEEIVVTAQRREQNLQEVPVSITAFSGALLERANITEAADYLSLTPNVSFTEGFSTGSRGIGIGIRGINNMVTDENTFVNSIGVYMDGFSVAAVPTGVVNPQLQDVDRIEVLRGPQGTLFGRNSVGGALNLTTKKPTTDRFEGSLSVAGESFEDAGEQVGVTGIVNIPLSETVAARAVIYYEDSSGMVENLQHSVDPSVAEDSGHEYTMGRLALRFTPSEATTADLMLMYTDEEQGMDETVASGVWDLDTIDTFGLGLPGSPLQEPADSCINHPNGPVGSWQDGNFSKVCRDQNEHNDNSATVGIFSLSHQFTDSVALKWITGFIDTENSRLFDNDLIGGADLVVRENDMEGLSWSTEVRTEITADSYDLVIGALYARDDIERQNHLRIGNSPADPVGGAVLLPPFLAGLCALCTKKDFEVESIALFTDFTWHASDRLDLIAGFRYTDDEVKNGIANPLTGGPNGKNTKEFDDIAPRLVARYQATDNLRLYTSVSKGYKAGGSSSYVDPRGGVDTLVFEPFDEETLWNYEAGFKSEWFDRRLRLNGAVFYSEWSDLQLESFRFLVPGDLSTNIEQTISVEDAEALGFELELAAAVTNNFTVTAAIGHLDSEITCDCEATIKASFPVDLKGVELPRSPNLTASLTGEYRTQLGDNNEAWVRLEYIHRGDQTTDIEGATYKQTSGRTTPSGGGRVPDIVDGFPYVSPDYDVVNLRAGFIWNDKIEFTGFVENLFEEEYWTGTQEDFGLSGFRLRPHPRIIGAGVSYRFDSL